MESPVLPITVIACRVFQTLLEKNYTRENNMRFDYLEYGLHKIPKKLNLALQERIDQLTEPHLILLGFGLCGTGLSGIHAGVHQLIIPRTDDCIAVLLGSYEKYRNEFLRVPGTYYLSKGWLESGSNPLQEFHDLEKKIGTKQAEWVMDQQYRNYRRLVFVAHSIDDLIDYRPKAKLVADYCSRWGMTYEEMIGSENYIKKLMNKPFSIDLTDDDILVVFPGEEINMEKFIR